MRFWGLARLGGPGRPPACAWGPGRPPAGARGPVYQRLPGDPGTCRRPPAGPQAEPWGGPAEQCSAGAAQATGPRPEREWQGLGATLGKSMGMAQCDCAHHCTVLGKGRAQQGCIRREWTSDAALGAVGQAVGRGCQSGSGLLLSVTNAIEAGTCRQGDSGLGMGWAPWRRGGGGGGGHVVRWGFGVGAGTAWCGAGGGGGGRSLVKTARGTKCVFRITNSLRRGAMRADRSLQVQWCRSAKEVVGLPPPPLCT